MSNVNTLHRTEKHLCYISDLQLKIVVLLGSQDKEYIEYKQWKNGTNVLELNTRDFLVLKPTMKLVRWAINNELLSENQSVDLYLSHHLSSEFNLYLKKAYSWFKDDTFALSKSSGWLLQDKDKILKFELAANSRIMALLPSVTAKYEDENPEPCVELFLTESFSIPFNKKNLRLLITAIDNTNITSLGMNLVTIANNSNLEVKRKEISEDIKESILESEIMGMTRTEVLSFMKSIQKVKLDKYVNKPTSLKKYLKKLLTKEE
jgi:hypothetical protein